VRVVATLVVLAIVVVVLAWAFQRRLIYLPAAYPAPTADQVLAGGSAVVVHTEDGLDLTAWHAPATGPATGTSVLVLPGNAGSRAARVPLARALSAAGFDVLLLDYRGYGGNPGSPTEQGLAADARRPTTISWRTAACLPPGWCCSGRAWARRSPACGCQKVGVRCCDPLILVDKAAEAVVSLDLVDLGCWAMGEWS
jgi:hypothetical protein